MRLRPRWVWLLPALLAVHAGCTNTKRELRPKKPEDPLLTTKTPVKARFLDTQDSRVLANAKDTGTSVLAASPASPGSPSASPVRLGTPQPVPAVGTASAALAWSTDKPQVSRSSTQSGSADPYARAADYRWLQGVLERTPNEQWLLRYETISREGRGGKVVLDGQPQSLDRFQTGDVIRVEGTLAEDKQPAPSDWLPYPRYHVASVRLIQHRE
jgi:hypothetical protein